MPSKKKKIEEVKLDPVADLHKELVEAEVNVEKTFYEAAGVPCGHINKQFIGKDGKQEDLACTLTKSHEGDHYAKFKHLVTDYGVKQEKNGSVSIAPVGSHEEESEGYWSDAAGEFPKPPTITPEEDYARLKKTRAAERGTDDQLSERIEKEVTKVYTG